MSFLFLFFLGLSIGSFINCLVYRLDSSAALGAKNWRGFLFGRSFCPKCKHKLAWYDNVPLLSFALLAGKCRYCHSPISWQYPVVELTAGVLTLLIFQFSNFPFFQSIFNLLITYALIAIFVSDLRYMIIPDKIVYPTLLVTLFFLISQYPNISISNFLSALGTAGFFYFLVLITRGRGMGMGDVKLVGLMGLILGWPRIIVALFLAFLTGAVVGAILVLLKKKRFEEHIPFGPFLVAGTFVALFWGEKIWQQINAVLL